MDLTALEAARYNPNAAISVAPLKPEVDARESATRDPALPSVTRARIDCALCVAAEASSNATVVEALLARRADATARNAMCSPLKVATLAAAGAGADVNACANSPCTDSLCTADGSPLTYALLYDRPDSVRTLLAAGADPLLECAAGDPPWRCVQEGGAVERSRVHLRARTGCAAGRVLRAACLESGGRATAGMWWTRCRPAVCQPECRPQSLSRPLRPCWTTLRPVRAGISMTGRSHRLSAVVAVPKPWSGLRCGVCLPAHGACPRDGE